MPSENDWVLNGLSSDPSLMRDYISYNLANLIGQYASRTAYCEVMVNGSYVGLYLLQEKIKPDKNRVNVVKIEPGNNTLPELSGGYITKTDKITGGDPIAWYMSSTYGYNDNQFIHHWPKPADVTTQQNNYIKSIFQISQSVCSSGNVSISNGYPSVIDIPAFVDFMLINEISSNADAYTYSTYYHKDRGGKLRAGPIWDMNLTYGNDLFNIGFDRSKPDVWQFSNGTNEGPKYFRDLFNNASFKCYLSRRWNELTQPGRPFHAASLVSLIDNTVVLISEAVVRENARWGTVGNHQSNVNALKSWLNLRLPWMTSHLGSFSACQTINAPALVITKINYHPAVSGSFPDEDKLEFLEITNAGSSSIDLTSIYFSGTGLSWQFSSGSSLPAGTAVYLASDAPTFQNKFGFTPYGQFTRNLSNSNQNLVLSDAFGNEIDHVHYYDDPPWPDADGNGKFLQLISTGLDNSLASSWIAMNDNTVGVDFLSRNSGIRVFPNPTSGPVQIRADQIIISLEILDMQGRVLDAFAVHEPDFSLNLTHLPDGVYFLRIVTANEVRFEKVVKN